jgi:hypothetical protein
MPASDMRAQVSGRRYLDNNFLNRDVFGAQQLSVFEVGENGEDPAVVIRPCFEVEL